MSSFSKVKRELVSQGDGEIPRGPCRECGSINLKETLSNYGGLCPGCYRDYCKAPQHFPDVGDKRIDGPRGWAHALKRRHEQGDRLTPAQVSAYKAALRTTEEA
jgi:hypothetical protein